MASPSNRRGAATLDVVLCAALAGQLHVLIVKAAAGGSVLPFQWIREGDALEPTARELARDATGIVPAWIAAGTPTTAKRHPSDAALSLPFVGVVGPTAAAAAGAVWHPVSALPALAPRQRAMAESALETLRLHMDSAPVAFKLLAPAFTLSELQQAYELLLGRRLHKASFRRALQAAYLVEPTDEWRSEGRGRPAQLFRYAPRKRRAGHRSIRFDLIGR
jgi:8-oxo-dGTP diphosphatase